MASVPGRFFFGLGMSSSNHFLPENFCRHTRENHRSTGLDLTKSFRLLRAQYHLVALCMAVTVFFISPVRNILMEIVLQYGSRRFHYTIGQVSIMFAVLSPGNTHQVLLDHSAYIRNNYFHMQFLHGSASVSKHPNQAPLQNLDHSSQLLRLFI